MFINPVIPGFYPDPSICRVGEDYYLVTSSFEYFPGVPIFHSRDLINWRQIGHCLTRSSQVNLLNSRSSKGIYAPTIRYHQGKFYMVTTNVSDCGNFYVWTSDPTGEWSDPILVDQGGIDPSLLFDDDGKVYFTSNGYEEGLGIYQCEIDIATGIKLSPTRKIWGGTGGAYPEAPHLYNIAGTYYLMIAEGGTEYGHMETIARSNSPYGPFESCPQNPILTHRSVDSPIQATGHADLVQAHDGSWWAVFLGIRPIVYPPRHHLGRETFLAPVTWTEDGWPVIGNNGRVDLQMDVPTLPQVPWPLTASRDDFDEEKLGLEWNFLNNGEERDWSLKERTGWLRLYGSAEALKDTGHVTFVGRRQQHFNCAATTKLEFGPSQDGEEAGITVLMNHRFHYDLAVVRVNGERCLLFRRQLGDLIKEELTPIPGAQAVQLSVEADIEHYVFSYLLGNGDKVIIGKGECGTLSKEVAGGYTGVYFGLYATGKGRRCSVPADFGWFEYRDGSGDPLI
ncbi:MAG: glycoside hydrolase family 43 protein [Gorillibacterium sp.]|nr:glycoside hydrolase family 43 protein [Gorillibacterium sp.]